MSVEVLAAAWDDYDVIRNLVTFYVYDLAEVMGWECPETGRFDGCADLPQYWGRMPAEPQFQWPEGWHGYPFLVRVDSHLAGFALIRRLAETPRPRFDVGEFFVLRSYRGRGIGRMVSRHLFDLFRGEWEVRVMIGNDPALLFWRRVIAEYTSGQFDETVEMYEYVGWEMHTQRFLNLPNG